MGDYLKIIFAPTTMDSKSMIVEFYDYYVLESRDSFNGVNAQPMTTYFKISFAIIVINGVVMDMKSWKVTDLMANANVTTTTIINEEEPNFISHHFENMQGVVIEQEEIEKGDEINLIIESVNGDGRSVTINLDDELLDYEYNGKRLENDILKNIILTGDVTTIKLKAIKQKK